MNFVIDIETDGLYNQVTKIHCLSYHNLDTAEHGTLTDYQEIKDFLNQEDFTFIGHNIIRYDIPVLEKILGITYNNNIIDTLSISWYLFPDRHKHGLESYGEDFNIPKPIINDWHNLNIEDYKNRCETDVKINTALWLFQKDYLEQLYPDGYKRLVGYLNFKFKCLLEQEMVGITLNTQLCSNTKEELEKLIEEKVKILVKAMPKEIGKVIRKKPTVLYKKDGSLSAHGTSWFKLLEELNLPLGTEEVYEEPNPGSSNQLKKWLTSLGWKPTTFKVSKATGEKVAQVSLPNGGGICPSVKELYPIEPSLEELEGLFMLQHRLGIIKSFENNKDENDKIYATAHGYSNTLRLCHSVPIVNLPSVFKPYGKEIRGCLKTPSNAHIMFGADISALEDSSKQHYMYFFDPEYVKQMRVPGFDPHIDIAILSELMSKEQADTFKMLDKKEDKTPEEKKEYAILKDIRSDAKTINFAGVYGAGPPKIAETLKKPLAFAEKLHKTYWERNKAVKQVANSTTIKEVNKRKWQYNPISGFWYYLKAEKDRFSTLNQGSGSYIFDTWLRKMRDKLEPIGVHIILQYHDEAAGICLKFQKPQVESIIAQAMDELNEELKLNVPIGFSIDWGNNYGDVH